MTSDDDFYITGGTLPPDADSYIVRQADTDLYDGLRRGDFCYVLNTRQMGKSSLMVRTARRLRAEGRRVVVLDLTAVGQNLSVEQWYFGLLLRTGNQTGHAPALTAFWKSNRELGPMQRFLEALREVLLTPPEPDDPVADLVVFVDEIDAVLSLSFSADEFFAGVRECYNRRAHDAQFHRLTFCLVGVAAPTDLVQDTRISPFNIGQRIELRDFTTSEAEPLARGLHREGDGHAARNSLQLLRRVLHWTGGHPYMTQRLCQATAAVGQSRSGTHNVDVLCRDLFLSDAAQETDDNLTFIRNRLLRSGTDTSTLLDFYLRIRRGNRVRDDNTNPLCSLLRLSGVVRHDKGWLRIRNRIYWSVFSPAWVQMNLPGEEVRRQRRAYQSGIWRATTAGGIGILIFASLAAVAMDRSAAARRASREARTQEAIARTRLSGIYVDNGVRLMDAGDYGGALAPFAEAMMLDKNDPTRLAMHRRRFAAVLARTPHLDHLWGSDRPLRWASYSPDKRWVATAGEDGWVHVREADTGSELPLRMHHDSAVLYADFSPNGRWLVTCGSDARAFIWDLKACRLLRTLQLKPQGDPNPEVTYAAWNREGRRLALSCGDSVSVWEVGNGQATPRRLFQNTYEHALRRQTAFTPDGMYLASVADNYLGWFVSLADGRDRFRIGTRALGDNYCSRHIALSKDGRRLLVAGSFGGAGQNTGVCVLGVGEKRERPLIPLLYHEQPATYAAFSPDERQIATASNDGTARVWDTATGKPISPSLRHGGPVLQVAFSPDGRRLVTAGADGEARVWDAVSGKPLCAPLHHAGAVVAAQFGSDGKHIFTASRDGTARLWTLPNEESLFQRINHDSPSGVSFSFTRDGTRLLTRNTDLRNAATVSNRVRLFDLTGDRLPLAPLIDAPGFSSSTENDQETVVLMHGTGITNSGDTNNPVNYSRQRDVRTIDEVTGRPLSPLLQSDWASLNHAGTRLLLGDRRGNFRLVDAMTGKPVLPPLRQSIGRSFYRHFQPFTPDDRRFLLCDTPRSVRLFDVESGRPVTPPMVHKGRVAQWMFTPDGRYLFTWTDDRDLQAWNVADGTPASRPVPASEPVHSGIAARITPDNRQVFTASNEGYWLWSIEGPGPLRSRHLKLKSRALVLSPDGKRFVPLEESNWLWDTDSLAPIGTSFNDGAEILAAAFRPDSQQVLVVRDDGTALLWNVDPARPATPPLLQKKITHCAFSEDGRMMATGGADGICRVWDAATGEPITPPLRMWGGTYQIGISSNGRWLIAGGPSEGRMWNLTTTTESPERLQAWAQLLSGQRIDPIIGSVPIDPVTIRAAWARVSGTTDSSRRTSE